MRREIRALFLGTALAMTILPSSSGLMAETVPSDEEPAVAEKTEAASVSKKGLNHDFGSCFEIGSDEQGATLPKQTVCSTAAHPALLNVMRK